jgi:hypothetical protein
MIAKEQAYTLFHGNMSYLLQKKCYNTNWKRLYMSLLIAKNYSKLF